MSAAQKKMLTGIQPIELNATTRLLASQASIRLVVDASICARCSASTVMSPAAVTALSLIQRVGAAEDGVDGDDAADAVPRDDVAVLGRGDQRRVGGDDRDVAAGRSTASASRM